MKPSSAFPSHVEINIAEQTGSARRCSQFVHLALDFGFYLSSLPESLPLLRFLSPALEHAESSESSQRDVRKAMTSRMETLALFSISIPVVAKKNVGSVKISLTKIGSSRQIWCSMTLCHEIEPKKDNKHFRRKKKFLFSYPSRGDSSRRLTCHRRHRLRIYGEKQMSSAQIRGRDFRKVKADHKK